jgi:Zn-dependent protease with chaperone function
MAAPLARHQPRALLALVITAGVVVATYQAAARNDWSNVAVLSSLAVCAVVVPIADTAVSRVAEYAADTRAARSGYEVGLAAALRGAEPTEVTERPWLLRHHPSTDRRLRRLDQAAVLAPM